MCRLTAFAPVFVSIFFQMGRTHLHNYINTTSLILYGDKSIRGKYGYSRDNDKQLPMKFRIDNVLIDVTYSETFYYLLEWFGKTQR
ncbi:MAG: hypothetical protein ACT6FE_07640 [Methanosarcinaceae archaeon]